MICNEPEGYYQLDMDRYLDEKDIVLNHYMNEVNKNVRRGFAPEDERQFSAESVQLLRKAGTEVRYLLNRGYHLKSVRST